ncbi:MAG: ATP-binding protein [Sphingopyxis sp.]|uniref:hybrid sensor histidine kinase/response regulator n=1 Tax=Sphingopyxis sp. TaxID=1908224 RepID=UPI002AB95EC7|nr:ATP-binding protein [Sphingopyxis sp.]MDZ3832215.1 ATP-binding protein [Sphingopyxis sp.]
MRWSHYLNPVEWFRLQPSSAPDDIAAEFGQYRVRFAMWIIVTGYIMTYALVFQDGFSATPWAVPLLLVYVVFGALATLIWLFAKARPGHYPIRRLLAILLDTTTLAYSIISYPWVMMPVYAVLVWSVVGNGLRYGRAYLVIATIFTQIALVCVYVLSPFTIVEPYMVVTLSLTALAVPVYASLLLSRVDRARQAAELASLSKSRFLAQASHDLRQPLHATSLFIGSLREKGLNGEQAVIVDRIERSLTSVTDLFRSLLDVSMLDSGRLTPKREVIALGPMLTDMAVQNGAAVEWTGADLRVAPTQRHIVADRALLTSMVQNLLSNAIKYSGGRSVLLGTRMHGGKVAIEVWDQGPGISADHLPRVFDEFYQVRETGDPDRQGVGLGLSIVERLSGLMALTTRIDSRPGKGTRVAIRGLPPVVVNPPPRAPSFPAAQLPLNGYRILLVEDDRDMLAVAGDLLAGWGCTVEAHLTIPDRLAEPCDMLITDFDLGGGVTGTDCIAFFRSQAGNAPVIVLTGHDAAPIRDSIGDPDAIIVKKPVRPAELRSLVAAALIGRTPFSSRVEQAER